MKEVQADIVWLLTFAVVVWIGYAVVRALVISGRTRAEPRSAGEEFSRAEKVRQEIRRKKAQRQANPEAVQPPPQPPIGARAPRGVPPLDPFGGSWRGRWRRWLGGGEDKR